MSGFQKATKKASFLRLALLGPAGSGKTYSALKIAKGLGEKIALIDTEHGSARLYAGDVVDFDVIELESFEPEQYIKWIGEAERAGYDVLIIDSLSHAWSGKGGILEFVDRTKKGPNSFNAWGDATPKHNNLVEALLKCRMHLVVTMRTKMEYVQEKDPNTGKTTIRKLGLQPVQRDGLEYEFTIVGDLNSSGLTISKTRCPTVEPGAYFEKPGEKFAKTLLAWLSAGEAMTAPALAPNQQLAPATKPAGAAAAPKGPSASAFVKQYATEIAACGHIEALIDVVEKHDLEMERLKGAAPKWHAVAGLASDRKIAELEGRPFAPAANQAEAVTMFDRLMNPTPASPASNHTDAPGPTA